MWNIVQCAVQGRSHINEKIPCQDKTFFRICDDTFVIALADGAGSAKLSHYGAETATKYICDELAEKFDEYYAENDGVLVKMKITGSLTGKLHERSEEIGCETKDLASTLLFAAIKKDRFILAHIGDGVIGYLKKGELKIASYPENGEFVNTTVFTTSENAITTMKLLKGYLGEIEGFVLMSDGTETALYNKREHKLIYAVKKIMLMSEFINAIKIEDGLKASFDNVVKTVTTDDCSIILMVKKNNMATGYMQLSDIDKCRVLGINERTSKKTLKKYDEILNFTTEKKTLVQISRRIYLKEKYLIKYIEQLCGQGFIDKNGNFYQNVLYLD